MSVWLLLAEVKRNAHAGHTREQGARYLEWITRAERAGRATTLGYNTLVGNDWAIECDDQDEADWLHDWLIRECGFTETMIRTSKNPPRTNAKRAADLAAQVRDLRKELR